MVLFMPLLFLSQRPSSLSDSFIISQASMGQFQNCCHGIAAQSLLGSNEAAVGYYLSHILWEFCGMDSLRVGPVPEACAFLSRRSFSRLPTQLKVMMLLKIISVSWRPENGPGCLYLPSTAAPTYVQFQDKCSHLCYSINWKGRN